MKIFLVVTLTYLSGYTETTRDEIPSGMPMCLYLVKQVRDTFERLESDTKVKAVCQYTFGKRG